MSRPRTIPLHALKYIETNLYRNGHGIYFGWIFSKGKQVKRSLKTRDLSTARGELTKLRRKVGGLSTQKNVTFDELADQWLESIKGDNKESSYQRRVTTLKAGLRPAFGKSTIRSISLRDIEERWKIKRGPELSPRSFNIELETLNLVMAYAEKHGLILENPAASIKRRTQASKKPEIPTKAQFAALVQQLRLDPRSNQAADWVEFAGYSGTRIDESRNIKWTDVNFALGTLLIKGDKLTGTKNSKERTIPLFPPLRAFLEDRQHEKEASAELFPRRTARGEGKTKWTPKQAIATACEKAGLPHFTPHHMRHFFCSNAIEAGIDFKAIAGWLGHQDGGVLVATTYGHLRQEHSAEMAKRMTFSLTPAKEPDNVTPISAAA